MKKVYLIKSQLEAGDYDENDDIFDSQMPTSIRKEMERVAKIEKVPLRSLSYKREIYWDDEGELPGWVDLAEISLKSK